MERRRRMVGKEIEEKETDMLVVSRGGGRASMTGVSDQAGLESSRTRRYKESGGRTRMSLSERPFSRDEQNERQARDRAREGDEGVDEMSW